MKRNNPTTLFLLGISIALFSCSTDKNNKEEEQPKQYSPVSKELYDTIARIDSMMFDAFNAHDLEKSKSFFADTLEFYHDKGGLADYAQTMENLKNLFENNKTTGLRRDLVKGSMEVYPIKNYGAVETGLHTFCHDENGKQDCGTFKFLHIWQKRDGQWKVTRVISYDH